MTERKDALRRALLEIRRLKAERAAADTRARAPIAVVGLGCRLPGAPDPDALWALLDAGRDATGEVPPGRFAAPVPPEAYTTRGGWLDAVDGFDAAFFGISAREAEALDPQQRLWLEVVYEALEHAAIDPHGLRGSATGVYCGVTQVDYAQVLADHGGAPSLYAGSGTAPNFAAGRVARTLDLRGPALSIDTACSSSLVAVHHAVEALRRGAVDLAIAGGVNLMLHPAAFAVLCRGRALSRDGRCHTFDAAADGYGRGEGCAVVVLARLDDALAAGRRVLAVIRGSAINHDGASAGLTVPSGAAQARVIAAACADAGVAPGEVAYVEAHGTGTALGDPIELRALADALGRERTAPLLVGALKTNIGHLESAAGAAGLCKLVLALHHGRLPAHVGFVTPNPAVEWGSLPIEVVRAARPWPDGRRVGGVSAFGASGTNAHLIVEAAPPVESAPSTDAGPALLVLSAHHPEALRTLADRLADRLEAPDPPRLADVAHTLATGRAALPHALAVVAGDPTEAAAALRRATPAERPRARPPIAFMFAGQGAQRPGMARALYESEPVFRDALDRCAAGLRLHRDGSLIDVLYGADGALLDQTRWTQPALFAVEWALAAQWQAWGVEPDLVVGHSLGAFVAATLAGVFELDAAIALVARRAELMHAAPPGAMAAVAAPEHVIIAALDALGRADVELAVVNGPAACVVSGAAEAVDDAIARLEADGVECRRLRVERAFHSPLMDGALDAFEAAVAAAKPRPPRLTFISDTTGRPTDDVTTPAYWRRHLRAPVRFDEAVRALRDAGAVGLEIGPGATLTALARKVHPGGAYVASLRRRTPDRVAMRQAAGALWCTRATVRLDALTAGRPITLPTMPFQRTRYWAGPGGRSSAAPLDLLGRAVSAPDGEARFEAVWRASADGVLRDHRVFGQIVVSGAVTSAVALLAARRADGEAPRVVSAIEFVAPLVLDPAAGLPVAVRLIADAGGRRFEVASRAGARRVHVRGRIDPADDAPPPPVALDAVRARCTEALDGEGFYTRHWDPAVHHLGPSYRLIEHIAYRPGEALARLQAPTDADALADAIGRVEAAGQLLMPAAPDFEVRFADPESTFIGAGMRRSVELPATGAARWVHVRLTEATPDALVGDVALLDEQGRAQVLFEGLSARRMARPMLRVVAAPQTAPTPTGRAELTRWLGELVGELLGRPAALDTPLGEQGFDSLMGVELAERLGPALTERLGPTDGLRRLPLAALLERMAVDAPRAPADPDWPRLAGADAPRRLIALPHAGAGPGAFDRWPAHLPAGWSLHAARLPGHGDPRPPLTTLEATIEHLAATLAPLLDRPYVLFGASFGARLAHALVDRLARDGRRLPDRLVVAAAPPPDRPPAHAPRAEAVRAALTEGDRDALVALDLLPDRATARALPRVLPPLRADLSMLLDAPPVEPRPLPVPITALGGRDDPLVSRAALLGWAAHTEADFALRQLAGGHLIHQHVAAEVLAAATGA